MSKYEPQSQIRFSYNGALLYPGMKIGFERPYQLTSIEKYKRRKVKTKLIERNLTFSLGMYHHTHYHTNYFLQGEWVRRKQKSKGFYFERAIGTGFSKTFYPSPTFKVDGDGNVSKVPLAGNFYGLFTYSNALGYNFNLKYKKPFSIYVKPSGMVLFPHNSLVTIRPTLELGGTYVFNGLWDANVNYKNKIKGCKKYRPQS